MLPFLNYAFTFFVFSERWKLFSFLALKCRFEWTLLQRKVLYLQHKKRTALSEIGKLNTNELTSNAGFQWRAAPSGFRSGETADYKENQCLKSCQQEFSQQIQCGFFFIKKHSLNFRGMFFCFWSVRLCLSGSWYNYQLCVFAL